MRPLKLGASVTFVFGLLRAKAAIFLADVLDTLTTLARLVRGALRLT